MFLQYFLHPRKESALKNQVHPQGQSAPAISGWYGGSGRGIQEHKE